MPNFRRTRNSDKPQGVSVRVPAGEVVLEGDLNIPEGARGIVIFAHGSGSSRHSPRNRYVAQMLHRAGLGTLLFDLLTAEEESIDMRSGELRFDIGPLAGRLFHAGEWVTRQPQAAGRRIGYFGASTGAAAALVAAARVPHQLAAVVSRGGRPDLAGPALPKVRVPTLLIVGGEDNVVLELNRRAMAQMNCEKHLAVVAGATHLFEEPGTLEQAAELACSWFATHLGASHQSERRDPPHVA
jgi:putative phosphoribosyl transferase